MAVEVGNTKFLNVILFACINLLRPTPILCNSWYLLTKSKSSCAYQDVRSKCFFQTLGLGKTASLDEFLKLKYIVDSTSEILLMYRSSKNLILLWEPNSFLRQSIQLPWKVCTQFPYFTQANHFKYSPNTSLREIKISIWIYDTCDILQC